MMVIVYAIIIILYAAWQYFRRLDAFARIHTVQNAKWQKRKKK
jgi:hypothetical protein